MPGRRLPDFVYDFICGFFCRSGRKVNINGDAGAQACGCQQQAARAQPLQGYMSIYHNPLH
jgi:hypothetical protein